MKRAVGFVFFSILWTACTPLSETNWSFLPAVENAWESVHTYGGTEEDLAHAVIATSDGGFAVVGNTQSLDGDFTMKTREGSDVFLMKFDSKRSLEWTKTYGGSEDDRGHDLVQLSDGGYALVGYSKSNDGDLTQNKGQHDNWILRTDTVGNLLWEKSFGFLGHDHAYNIISTSDGGLLFNGFLDVTASKGMGQDKGERLSSKRHGVGEFWVHKIDLEGNLQWRKYFGGSSNDRSYDAIETSEGDYVIVGSSESQDVDIKNPKGSYDIWVVKIDIKGNLLWERSLGGSDYDQGNAVLELPNGDYLILGQTYSSDGDILKPKGGSDILIARISAVGALKEVRTMGTSGFDTAKQFLRRADGTLLIVGESSAFSNEPNNNDVILYYTLANGSIIKKTSLGGEGLEEGNGLATLTDGRVVVVGSTSSHSSPFSQTKGNKDLFIAFWY